MNRANIVGNINVNELTKYIKSEIAAGRPIKAERQKEEVYLMTSYLALVIPAALYNHVLKEALCEPCPDAGKIVSLNCVGSTICNTVSELVSSDGKNPVQLTDAYIRVPDGKKKSKLVRIIAGDSCGIAVNDFYCKIALENGGNLYGSGAADVVVCRYCDDVAVAVCPVRLTVDNKNIADAIANAAKTCI